MTETPRFLLQLPDMLDRLTQALDFLTAPGSAAGYHSHDGRAAHET
jgi:hypothetical protein